MDNKEYKYKPYKSLLIKQQIFLLLQSIVCIALILCFVFLKIFDYGVKIGEETIRSKFSIYDEVKYIYQYYSSIGWRVKFNFDAIIMFLGLEGLIMLATTLIKNFIVSIKCIIFLCTIDSSTLLAYDDIQRGKGKLFFNKIGPKFSFLKSIIFFTIFYLFNYKLSFDFGGMLESMLGRGNSNSSSDSEVFSDSGNSSEAIDSGNSSEMNDLGESSEVNISDYYVTETDYFSNLLGLNKLAILVASLFVIYIAMVIVVYTFNRIIKVKILKEVYAVKSTNNSSEDTSIDFSNNDRENNEIFVSKNDNQINNNFDNNVLNEPNTADDNFTG